MLMDPAISPILVYVFENKLLKKLVTLCHLYLKSEKKYLLEIPDCKTVYLHKLYTVVNVGKGLKTLNKT